MANKRKPKPNQSWERIAERGTLDVRDTVVRSITASHGLDADEATELRRALGQGVLDVPAATVRIVRAFEHFCHATRQPLVTLDVPRGRSKQAVRSLVVVWFEGCRHFRTERRRLYTILAKFVSGAKDDAKSVPLPRMMTIYRGAKERWGTYRVHASGHAGLDSHQIESVLAELPNAFHGSRTDAMVDEVHEI